MAEKAAKKTVSPDVPDPNLFAKNFVQLCKLTGIPYNQAVVNALQDPKNAGIPEQLIVSGEDDEYPQGCIRALMTALMGSSPGMKGGPYKALKHLRVWKYAINDEGTAAIAEVLRLGGAEIKILFLELMETNTGPLGAAALGHALSRGNNMSLLTLKIEFNQNFGSEGCINLCQGLRTNSTLKQLHLNYVNMDETAGSALSSVLSNVRSSLEVLSVAGNSLRGNGLYQICQGLRNNVALKKLNLSDNKIDQTSEDVLGLTSLRDSLLQPSSGIISLNLLYNRIGHVGGRLLLPVRLEKKGITEFLVDISLPMELFQSLFLRGDAGKTKKGGKKKKKA